MSEEQKVEKIFSLEIVKKGDLAIIHAEMEKKKFNEMLAPIVDYMIKSALPPKIPPTLKDIGIKEPPPPEPVKEESKSAPKSPEI